MTNETLKSQDDKQVRDLISSTSHKPKDFASTKMPKSSIIKDKNESSA